MDTPRVAGEKPAAPVPPAAWPTLEQARRVVRDNVLAIWPRSAYEDAFIDRSSALVRVFLINDPEAVQHVLLGNAANYVKSVAVRRQLRPVLGDGLITAEGVRWQHARHLLAPAFRGERITSYVPAMAKAAAELGERWTRPASAPTIDAGAEMTDLTLAIISRTMFSQDLGPAAASVCADLARYRETLGRVGLADILQVPEWATPWRQWRARLMLSRFDRAVAGLIARRRGTAPADDLLALLLEARGADGRALPAAHIHDEVATILAAGHETTASVLIWCWYLLSLHTRARERMERELDGVLGGRLPEAGDVPHLSFTGRVIEEAMRLYPPVHAIERRALGADEVAGHPIPAGSVLIIAPWLLHRHRRLWEDPERFDPDRFAPERTALRHRFAYVPFGGGPRVCLGAAFALTEAVVVLATLGQRFRLDLVPGQRVEPVGRITVRPRDPLMMTVTER